MCSVYNNILFHIIALITVQNIESKVLLAKDCRDTVVKQFIYLFIFELSMATRHVPMFNLFPSLSITFSVS